MSSASNWSLSNALAPILGGGLSVRTGSGGFSTIYDPSTGSYKTSIQAGNTSVVAAGAGQTPVPLWQSLSSTTSGNWLLFGVVAIVIILVIGSLRKRL